MIKKLIFLQLLLLATLPLSAQDISIFFLKDGSIIQGKVVNENQQRIFLKTEQGTIKILPKNILGREDLAKKGDLTFMVDRMDYFQNHVNQLTGQVNHWNDSLNLALDDLYELFKNLEVLQNEFEIDLLRLHSQGREQKKQITYVQDDLVNQRVDIAFNRQNMGGIDDTVSTLHKQFDKARKKLDVTVDQSYLISGTISNMNTEIQRTTEGQQNQQNQIDIMAGSLANLIQEVQQVQNSFAAVEEGIQSNQDAIQKLAGNLSAQTEELTSGMGEMSDDFTQQMKTISQMLDDFTQQIKTIGQTLDDQDNKSLRARKKILNDLNDFKDEFSKLKGKVTSLNNDINSLEGDIKAINKKVDNIPTGE
jgi:chromosome segregation ATPase